MEEGGECTLWRTHRSNILFVLIIFKLNLLNCKIFRLDGQVDVVDSPKTIKSKDINTPKLDKNLKTESPINKTLGN